MLSDAKANTESLADASANAAMDDSVVMLALAIFILSAPKEVVLTTDLQKKCINVFTRCIRATSMEVLIMKLTYLEVV